MKGIIVVSFLLIGILVMLTVRSSCSNFKLRVCSSLCDSRGRSLNAIDDGAWIVKCLCGDRKTDPSIGLP